MLAERAVSHILDPPQHYRGGRGQARLTQPFSPRERNGVAPKPLLLSLVLSVVVGPACGDQAMPLCLPGPEPLHALAVRRVDDLDAV